MRYTPSPRTAGPEVGLALVPRACRAVVPGYPQAPPTVAPVAGEARTAESAPSGSPASGRSIRGGGTRQVLYPPGAGLAVHQKTVGACLIPPAPRGGWQHETRTLGTRTRDLVALLEWRLAAGCAHVAMESTGEDGKPGFNLLEAHGAVRLVQAQPSKAGPGRKTEGKEAQGIAELWQPG